MRALPWVLLGASVGLNALLMMRARAAPEPVRAAAPGAQAAAPSGGAAPRTSRLFGAFTPPPPPPSGSESPAATVRAPAAVDDALIQEVWCTLAEQRAREGWRRDRESITQSLKHSLADSAVQEKNTADTGVELAGLVDVPARAREDFQRRYRERRLQRVASAVTALDAAPPDYGALLAAAEGLFADEDALAREFGGDAGRDRVRAAWLEGRTSFLAVAAALADAPDRAIRW
jgi:hypothetical protein